MRNLKKKVVVFATAASLAVVSMTGCASFENADTVATVGGDKIPAGVANFYARYQQGMIETNLGSMLGDNMWTQEVSEGKTYEDNVKDSVMDALQQMYILEDHMAEYEVALTDEEKSAIQEAAKKFDEGNELVAFGVLVQINGRAHAEGKHDGNAQDYHIQGVQNVGQNAFHVADDTGNAGEQRNAHVGQALYQHVANDAGQQQHRQPGGGIYHNGKQQVVGFAFSAHLRCLLSECGSAGRSAA